MASIKTDEFRIKKTKGGIITVERKWNHSFIDSRFLKRMIRSEEWITHSYVTYIVFNWFPRYTPITFFSIAGAKKYITNKLKSEKLDETDLNSTYFSYP